MSPSGRARLISREGKKNRAYRDTKGIWTIGVGHTAAAGSPYPTPGMVITDAEVDAILARDLPRYEQLVLRTVTVPLTQGQFDALVSIAFNVEAALSQKSSIVKRLNAGNYRGAADAILLWNKPAAIIGRRRGEYQQFLAATPNEAPGAPVRFLAADDLHDGEDVSLDYLRAAGSRIVTAADRVKSGAATIGVGDALEMATQAKGYVDQAKELAQGFHAGAPIGELVDSYAPLLIGLGVGVAILTIAFLAWRAAVHIQAARLDDARQLAPVPAFPADAAPPAAPAMSDGGTLTEIEKLIDAKMAARLPRILADSQRRSM
jgi:GH24 family phage-related lysozyme (muramidase)